MRSPSIPAIRLRPSVRPVAVLIQLAILSALSGCTFPVVAQVPTVTLTLRAADLGTERDVRVIYRRISRGPGRGRGGTHAGVSDAEE